MIQRSPDRRARTTSSSPSAGSLTDSTSAPASACLTGTDLILATKPFASDDPRRSWWYVLSTALLLVAGLGAALWLPRLELRLVASILSGLLMLRFFVIYHDQQHHAILANSRVAEVVMWLFGVLAISPSSIWRSSHNHHHNHNSKLRGSHIGSFPIMTLEAYRKTTPVARLKYLFMRHPLTLMLGYVFVFLIGMCINPFINNPRKHWDGLLALLIHAAIGAALLWSGGLTALLLVQTLPCLIVYGLGSYLFYAQHNFPGVAFQDSSGWTYEGAALESSSYMKLHPIMAWFTANIGYHHIHHLNAKIPFYRLPEVMQSIPELQRPKITLLNPVEVYRCLRLKVWDVSRQMMTGTRGV